MIGRVTQSMLNTQLLGSLNRNLLKMSDLQYQMSTGRKLNRPSDDPVGLSYAMRYRSDLSANEQYLQNADSVISWLEYTDISLDQAGSVLQRVREQAVMGATGTNSESSLLAIRDEIKQLHAQLVDIANSNFNGKYVFNGQMTDKQPYSVEGASNSETDHAQILFELGVGLKMPVNVTGNQAFGNPGDPDNAFRVLEDLILSLESSDVDGINTALERLDSRFNQFLEVRSDVGAKMNRIELAEQKLHDINLNLTSLKSKTEDADIAQLITYLKTSENVYQASLSIGAKLIRPSLIDFLK